MARNWREVKEEIEQEVEKIWYDEPVEVTMSKKGIFPSNAGTMGKYFGNLFFLVCDTQAMGWWTCEPCMYGMIDDDSFTLDHCKKVFQFLNGHMTKLMGESNPEHNCPGPWMNLPKFWSFYCHMVESFDSIQTKEELRSLIWSWENYVNRINRYFYVVFPWELGNSMNRVDPKDFPELTRMYHWEA